MLRSVCTLFAAALALTGWTGTPASAQADRYPSQPVRVIVPFGAGGAADLVARPLALQLSEMLGQQFIIVNRPGADGVIGTAAVAKAAPDGYTMLITTGGFSANPSMIANLPYDALKDFAPVSQLAISYGLVLMVRPDSPVLSVKDLVERAKRDPGKLTYAMLGPGNSTHVTMELLKKAADVDITAVPYKSSAENTTAVLSGEVTVAPLSSNSAIPLIQRNQLRPIGVAGHERIPSLSDVPTVIEQGFPGVVNQGYFGVWFPAGTPRERVEFLYTAIKKALETEVMQRFVANSGYGVVGSTPDEFAAFLAKDIADQRAVLTRIGITPK